MTSWTVLIWYYLFDPDRGYWTADHITGKKGLRTYKRYNNAVRRAMVIRLTRPDVLKVKVVTLEQAAKGLE